MRFVLLYVYIYTLFVFSDSVLRIFSFLNITWSISGTHPANCWIIWHLNVWLVHWKKQKYCQQHKQNKQPNQCAKAKNTKQSSSFVKCSQEESRLKNQNETVLYYFLWSEKDQERKRWKQITAELTVQCYLVWNARYLPSSIVLQFWNPAYPEIQPTMRHTLQTGM